MLDYLKLAFGSLNLRGKLFIYFVFFNFAITITLGYVLFRVSYKKFFTSFIDQKVSVGLSLSREIDSDMYPGFTHPDMIHDPDYEHYFSKMRQALKEETNLTSLYTVLLSRKDETLSYAIEGTTNNKDSVWITNHLIGLKFYLDEYERPVVFWNNEEHRDEFQIYIQGYYFLIQPIDGEFKSLSINNEKILTVIDSEPLQIAVAEGIVDVHSPEKLTEIEYKRKGERLPLRFHFAKVEDPSFLPGQVFEETNEKIQNILNSIQYCRAYTSSDTEPSAFGNFLYIIVPILGVESRCTGAVILNISPKNIIDFRNSMLIATLGVSFMTFLIIIFISYLISGLFVAPLNKLTSAVQELSLGNLNTGVSIGTRDEFGFLAGKFNEMVINLKKAYEDTASLASIRNELQIARQIQESILPKEIPKLNGITISVTYEPMAQVGGDFYDFSILDENRLGVIIADVAGHGVPAAIIASMLKVAFSVEGKYMSDPASTLEGVNRIMLDKCGTHFITASCLLVDSKKKIATLAKAGHPPLMIVNSISKEVQEFKTKGRLIGVYETVRASNLKIKLKSKDRILLFTDGVMEVTNELDETFGEDNFKEFIVEYSHLGPDAFRLALMDRLIEWKANSARDLPDDVSLVVIDIE
jgi:serine phosphatase RsbU (regulator of sigma subunit)